MTLPLTCRTLIRWTGSRDMGLKTIMNISRKCVRLRHTCFSVDSKLSSILLPKTCHRALSRTIAQKAKRDDITPELSMKDPVFSDYVKHMVEEKALIPRYHAMLTAKLSDYDLRYQIQAFKAYQLMIYRNVATVG